VISLEVAAGDLFERQEAVPVGPVIDESRFQTGFDASDAAFVNVRFFLFPRRRFDVEIVQPLPIHEGYAQLFLLSRVDQHAFHG